MEHVPVGRILEPDEIAAFVRYLVSPAASVFTGQAVNVDGGVLA
jgi:3-oxoacyl-[acyl-carrier protein] reductase